MSAEVKAMLSIGGTLLLAVVSLHIYLGSRINELSSTLTNSAVLVESMENQIAQVERRILRVEDQIALVGEKTSENNAMLHRLIGRTGGAVLPSAVRE